MTCEHCSADLPADARFCMRCGRPMGPPGNTVGMTITDQRPTGPPLPPRQIPVGTVIGEVYRVDELVGEGGMGVVYRCTDHAQGRTVAVKTLHANLMGDADIRRRFAREARVMTGWSHPNIVAAYDCIETNDVHALVMEYIAGPTLYDYVRKWGGPLPLDDVLLLFEGLLHGMRAAHDRGIVHRDLKPQNILLQPDEHGLHPKIMDFGIAKVLEGTQYTVTGAVLGTCRYMSPEQVRSPQAIDHRSDIYSLGVTLYRVVTGRCPFESDSHYELMMAHVDQAPEAPTRYRPDTPPALEALILAALAKQPEDRPQSCDEFQDLLGAALADLPARKRSASQPLPSERTDGDGYTLALVAGGAFQMGPNRREIYLDDFYIGRTPVTNGQFATFLQVTGYRPTDEEAPRFLAHWRGPSCPARLRDHPVVFVSWDDARAYCAWAGRRLASEAEWEKAARGSDGRKYPWGREEPGSHHANFGAAKLGGTSPVGRYPDGASPFGAMDMAGNVWEWCEDVDRPEFYLNGPERNPRNTVQPGRRPHVVRGGSFLYDARSLRCYSRSSFEPGFRLAGVGFRCARSG